MDPSLVLPGFGSWQLGRGGLGARGLGGAPFSTVTEMGLKWDQRKKQHGDLMVV